MLRELHLRDLGVISRASLSLSGGLNVVTGETGVGKTLLVTSLGLLTGARGHARLVREGAAEALVEAVLDTTPTLQPLLEERGIEQGDDLVLVRRLGSDGRSRAWAGGQMTPVSTLAEIGERAVEIHGQGTGFALAAGAAQLQALDRFARTEELLADYREALSRLRAFQREADEIRTAESTRGRELEVLTYQLAEIDRAELRAGEEEDISVALARLEHADRLRSAAGQAAASMGSERAAGDLAEAAKVLESVAGIDPEAGRLAARAAEVASECVELSRDVRAWGENAEADPSRLEALRERRALLNALKRKHGKTIEEIVAGAEEMRARAEELSGSEGRLAATEAAIKQAGDEVEQLAGRLSRARRKAARQLTKLVSAELPALALPRARFAVEVAEAEPTEAGADRVRFLFSSRENGALYEIGKIASGGELSRAMIALTLGLAMAHSVPVLVFDEADQGVGGEAALELGRRLARLGRSHQVLVVSHLPQIAAFADRHVLVSRREDEVVVAELDEEGRLLEISRMLAGMGSSDLARGHAAELLELARAERGTQAPRAQVG